MRISDEQIKKLQEQSVLVQDIVGVGQEADQRDADRPLIRQVAREVINMPDREDLVADLKARIEAGQYNPTGDEIAEAMIRRNIADRVR